MWSIQTWSLSVIEFAINSTTRHRKEKVISETSLLSQNYTKRGYSVQLSGLSILSIIHMKYRWRAIQLVSSLILALVSAAYPKTTSDFFCTQQNRSLHHRPSVLDNSNAGIINRAVARKFYQEGCGRVRRPMKSPLSFPFFPLG